MTWRWGPAIPDDGISAEDLRPFGWSPGKYTSTCRHCGERHWDCDKRSRSCRPCAVKALAAPRPAPPKGPVGVLQDKHERALRLILDILYDDRLSAEERIARAGNSPGFDPVRDGRPAFPWPAQPEARTDLPAVGSFHG